MNSQVVTILNLDVEEFREILAEVVEIKLIELYPQINGKHDSELISRKEAAKLLNISLPTLSKHVKKGLIPAMRVGNKILFNKEELLQSLEVVQKFKYKC